MVSAYCFNSKMKHHHTEDHNLDALKPNQPCKSPFYWKSKLERERKSSEQRIKDKLSQQQYVCLTINIMADRYYAIAASYLDKRFVRKMHYIAVDEIGEKNWWETIDGIYTLYGLSASRITDVVAGFDLLPYNRPSELPASSSSSRSPKQCIVSKLDEVGLAVYMKPFQVPSTFSVFEIVHRIAFNLKIVCNLAILNRTIADGVKEFFGESLIVPDAIDWKSKLIENSSQKRKKLIHLFDLVCKNCYKDRQSAVEFLFIEDLQWTILEEFCAYMEIVRAAIDNLLKVDNSNLGDILPMLFAARKRIDGKPNSKVKEYFLRYFHKQFDAMMDLKDTGKEKSNRDYIFAAISNPKYKMAWVPDKDSQFLETMFINECQLADDGSNRTHFRDIPGPSSSNIDDFVSIILKTNVNSNRKEHETDRKVQEYLMNGRTNLNVLEEYPVVETNFRKYNTTVSSTPGDRLSNYLNEAKWPRQQLIGDRWHPDDLSWAFKKLNEIS